MLRGVVSDQGTAELAAIPGLRRRRQDGHRSEAGTERLHPGRVRRDLRRDGARLRPRLLVLVTIDEPHGQIYGGLVAAPAFEQIASSRPPVPGGSPRPADQVADIPSPGSTRGRNGSRAPRRSARAVWRCSGALRSRCATSLTTHVPLAPARSSSRCRARASTATTSRRRRWNAGAVALVVERRLELPVPQVLVRDARAAMAPAADVFFGEPTRELEVLGVTGTSGKTTTSFLLFAILAAAGRRPGLLGTVEARVGGERRGVVRTTPEAIDLQRLFREMLDAGDRSCAMEASSHASVLHRLDRVRFAALVFTNLSQDHLDFHGDMESYFQAKRRLFLVEPRPIAVVNVADEYGRRLAQELPDAVTFVGGRCGGARRNRAAVSGAASTLENALGALYAARALGIEDDAIRRGLESVRGVPGRFESVDAGPAVPRDRRLRAQARRPREGAASRARACRRSPRALRRGGRRRPRQRQAAGHGTARLGVRGRGDRYLRQPAQRGFGGDRRRDRFRSRRERRARAGSRCSDRAGGRAGRAGRRRPHRRQGSRAGSGVRGSNRSVR